MKKVFKKLIVTTLAVVMLAGSLAGCGGSGGSGTGNDGKPAKSNGKTITVYAQRNGLGDTWLPNAAEAYEYKTGTKVIVEYDAYLNDNLSTTFSNSDTVIADMYFVQGWEWGRWTLRDYIVDMTDFMNEKDENGKSLNDRMWGQMYYIPDENGNKIQSIVPFTTGVGGYAYNKEMMSYLCHDVLGWEEGHDYPVNTKELYEVMDALEKVQKDGTKDDLFTYTQSGQTLDVKPFVWSGTTGNLGATMQTWVTQWFGVEGMEAFYSQYENCDMLNDEGFYVAYEAVMDMLKIEEDTNGDWISTTSVPNCISYNHTASQSQLLLGHAVMCPTGSWFYSEMQATIEDENAWGFMPVPYLSDDEGNPITKEGVEMVTDEDGNYLNYVRTNVPDFFCIPQRSQNIEEAKEFLRFMLSEEYMPNLQTDTQSILCYDFDDSTVEKSVWLTTVEDYLEKVYRVDIFTGSKMQIYGGIQFYYNPFGIPPFASMSQGGFGSPKTLVDSATGKTITAAEQAEGVAVTENVYKFVSQNYKKCAAEWSETRRKADELF